MGQGRGVPARLGGIAWSCFEDMDTSFLFAVLAAGFGPLGEAMEAVGSSTAGASPAGPRGDFAPSAPGLFPIDSKESKQRVKRTREEATS